MSGEYELMLVLGLGDEGKFSGLVKCSYIGFQQCIFDPGITFEAEWKNGANLALKFCRNAFHKYQPEESVLGRKGFILGGLWRKLIEVNFTSAEVSVCCPLPFISRLKKVCKFLQNADEIELQIVLALGCNACFGEAGMLVFYYGRDLASVISERLYIDYSLSYSYHLYLAKRVSWVVDVLLSGNNGGGVEFELLKCFEMNEGQNFGLLEDIILTPDMHASNHGLTFLSSKLVGISIEDKEAWKLLAKVYLMGNTQSQPTVMMGSFFVHILLYNNPLWVIHTMVRYLTLGFEFDLGEGSLPLISNSIKLVLRGECYEHIEVVGSVVIYNVPIHSVLYFSLQSNTYMVANVEMSPIAPGNKKIVPCGLIFAFDPCGVYVKLISCCHNGVEMLVFSLSTFSIVKGHIIVLIFDPRGGYFKFNSSSQTPNAL